MSVEWPPRSRPGTRRWRISTALFHLGAALGFLLWFLGFMVVGDEWFLMWQSETRNGQEPAFRFYVTILAVLIFVNQPDADLD